jgi:hypothetical protein
VATSRDRVSLVRLIPVTFRSSRDKSRSGWLVLGVRFSEFPNKRGCLASRLEQIPS